jgi:hypothetical protein
MKRQIFIGSAGVKTGLIILFFFFSFTSGLFPQSMNLRFNTFIYSWERQDSFDLSGNSPKTFHMRSYQNLLFDLSQDKFSFNFNFQSEGDLVNRIGRGFNYRFYNLYVKGSNLFNVLDFRLGRQYVFGGAGKGAIDGIHFKIKAGKFKEYQLAAYGGYLTPPGYDFKSYPSLAKNYLAGAQFSYYGIKDLFVGLSYMNKHKKPQPYTALRLDSLFNTREVLIDTDSPAEQLAGLDFDYSFMNLHNFYGKIYYDINLNQLQRIEANARVTVNDNLRLSAGYFYRQPLISYNTIFWVFRHKQNQEIEGSIDYTLSNGINIYGRAANVFYENDNSFRLQLGFNRAAYGLSFIKYFGYAGESDGVSGYYYRQIIPDILSASVNADYSRYRLGEYDNERVNSFSGMLGLTYRPFPQLSVDAQGQFINNRVYKFDTRFLIGLSYWLFNKF